MIKLSKEEKKKLIKQIQDDYIAACDSKGSLPDRWNENKRLYDCDVAQPYKLPFEGAVWRHAPLTTPIIDTLVGSICLPITSNFPNFVGRAHGDASVFLPNIEKTMQFFLDMASFDSKVRQTARDTALYGKSIFRITYSEIAQDNVTDAIDVQVNFGERNYAGIRIDIIDPRSFFIAPDTPDGIPAAKIVGHVFYRRLAEIRQLQEDDFYLKEDVVGGDDVVDTDIGSLRGTGTLSGTDDAPVKLASMAYKCKLKGDKREKWYNITIAPEQGVLLLIEPMVFPRPPYFATEFQKENRFWCNTSVAQNLQGLQHLYNDLSNLIYNGSVMAAFPTSVGSSMGLGQEKVPTVQPFGFMDIDSTTPPQVISSNFNAGDLYQSRESVRVDAERVARISSAIMGVAQVGRRTATEAAHIQAGASSGLNEYLQTFAIGWSDAVAYMMLVLAANFNSWKPLYRDSVPSNSQQELLIPVRWEVNGRSPLNTPMGRLNQARQFVEIIAQTPAVNHVNWNIFSKSVTEPLELPNADKLIYSEEEVAMMQQQQMMQQAQMEAMSGKGMGGGSQQAGLDDVLSGQALATRATPAETQSGM